MKIYTKTGDKGETSLIGGTRVMKSDSRIDAYGNVDELNANIGLLRDLQTDIKVKNKLFLIQRELFIMGSILACEVDPASLKLSELDESAILRLENDIDEMNEVLPSLTNFILPGGHPIVSQAHICRCISRRAERSVILLSQSSEIQEIVIKYLNRLSDYFFVLARWLANDLKIEENIWQPG